MTFEKKGFSKPLKNTEKIQTCSEKSTHSFNLIKKFIRLFFLLITVRHYYMQNM